MECTLSSLKRGSSFCLTENCLAKSSKVWRVCFTFVFTALSDLSLAASVPCQPLTVSVTRWNWSVNFCDVTVRNGFQLPAKPSQKADKLMIFNSKSLGVSLTSVDTMVSDLDHEFVASYPNDPVTEVFEAFNSRGSLHAFALSIHIQTLVIDVLICHFRCATLIVNSFRTNFFTCWIVDPRVLSTHGKRLSDGLRCCLARPYQALARLAFKLIATCSPALSHIYQWPSWREPALFDQFYCFLRDHFYA